VYQSEKLCEPIRNRTPVVESEPSHIRPPLLSSEPTLVRNPVHDSEPIGVRNREQRVNRGSTVIRQ
jgi:hypothetical protein